MICYIYCHVCLRCLDLIRTIGHLEFRVRETRSNNDVLLDHLNVYQLVALSSLVKPSVLIDVISDPNKIIKLPLSFTD